MKKTQGTKALAAKSPAELQTELNALLKEQFGLRMQKATQQLTNTEKLKQVRRNIARARTLIHQKVQVGAGMSEETQVAAQGQGPAPRKTIIQTLTGRVVSDKMNKTVTVLVERRVKHALYGKVVTKSSKYHAHDENNEFKTGDLVEIEACRKLAKTKAWRVTRLIEKARTVELQARSAEKRAIGLAGKRRSCHNFRLAFRGNCRAGRQCRGSSPDGVQNWPRRRWQMRATRSRRTAARTAG